MQRSAEQTKSQSFTLMSLNEQMINDGIRHFWLVLDILISWYLDIYLLWRCQRKRFERSFIDALKIKIWDKRNCSSISRKTRFSFLHLIQELIFTFVRFLRFQKITPIFSFEIRQNYFHTELSFPRQNFSAWRKKIRPRSS